MARKPESPQQFIVRLVREGREAEQRTGVPFKGVWLDPVLHAAVNRSFAFPADNEALSVGGVPVRRSQIVRVA